MGKNSGYCYPFLSYVTVLFERFFSPFWHNVFLEKKIMTTIKIRTAITIIITIMIMIMIKIIIKIVIATSYARS